MLFNHRPISVRVNRKIDQYFHVYYYYREFLITLQILIYAVSTIGKILGEISSDVNIHPYLARGYFISTQLWADKYSHDEERQKEKGKKAAAREAEIEIVLDARIGATDSSRASRAYVHACTFPPLKEIVPSRYAVQPRETVFALLAVPPGSRRFGVCESRCYTCARTM
ncbi:hypothetical protein PUN28_013585 [Cardiocondyla obscurior]|uniref:Uncharacterized protein n=1 Tax=Cardiocondyla obscurior TaxID=286306 RepID=A0AAW2F7X4_9HYME